MESSAVRAGRPHPEERACRKSSANSNARARVSKDEERAIGFALMLRDASQRIWAVEAPALLRMRTAAPSCFETRRGAFGLWKYLRARAAATLLSMRASTNPRLYGMTVASVSLFPA